MTKYYILYNKVDKQFACLPKRYRTKREAEKSLMDYTAYFPEAGAKFTIARISNWHICDEYGNVDFDIDKIYD